MLTETEIKKDVAEENNLLHVYQLIVWNDDVNTFDWVIQSLIEICGHTFEQAQQCSLIIHHNGKYKVKEGSYDTLKPMKDALIERGIQATLESNEE